MKNTYDGLPGKVSREKNVDQKGETVVEAGSIISREAADKIVRLPDRVIKVEPFLSGGPWPIKEPEMRGNAQLKDIFALGFDPGVFGASDG